MKDSATRTAEAHDGAAADRTADVPIGTAVAGLLRAWSALFVAELAVAHRSLHWLVFGMVAAPVIGLGVWLGVCALLVAVAQTYTASWTLALLFGAAVQVLMLALLLQRLRRWSRDLTLPQSRAALSRAMERMS